MARNSRLARETLGHRLDAVKPVSDVPRPHRGWIRAIRDALGMSGPELAQRMGVRSQSVYDIEESEATGSIKLDTLRRAADAMGCDLVYMLVPRENLQLMVENQAHKKAERIIAPVAHHSRLEEQTITPSAARAQVDELAADLIDKRGLWTVDASS